MRHKEWMVLSVMVVVLWVAGCATATKAPIGPQKLIATQVLRTEAPARPTQARPELAATPTPMSEHLRIPIPQEAAQAVAWAQADLAQQSATPVEQIVVLSVEFVEWNDASLGCPEKGMMYAQVITPGYRILLKSGEKQYEYHSAQGREQAVLCKTPVQ